MSLSGLPRQSMRIREKVAISKQIKVIVASISGENTASMKLFERRGYDKCAHYKEVAEQFDRLLDIVDHEKILVN